MAVGYAAIVLIVLAMARLMGDRWLPATLLIYGPRFLLPLAAFPLLGWAVRRRSWRSAGAIGAATMVAAGPVMGLTVGFGERPPSTIGGEVMRVLTFNRGAGTVDLRAFHDLLDREEIDLVFLQETTNDPALRLEFPEGWDVNKPGTIATRLEIAEDQPDSGRDDGGRWFWPIRADRARVGRADRAPVRGDLRAPADHPIRPRSARGGRPGRLPGPGRLAGQADRRAADRAEPRRPAGDRRGRPEHDPREPAARPDPSTISGRVRSRGPRLRLHLAPRFPFARIDHVMVGPEWSVGRCWVGPDLGSDHLPMIAEVTLLTGAGP